MKLRYLMAMGATGGKLLFRMTKPRQKTGFVFETGKGG